MVSRVETTVKALIEFESELDKLRAEALEAKSKMIKDAESLAESVRSGAILKAQQQGSERLAKARAEAEDEAESIKREGESALSTFGSSISKRKVKATERVVRLLLGETQ